MTELSINSGETSPLEGKIYAETEVRGTGPKVVSDVLRKHFSDGLKSLCLMVETTGTTISDAERLLKVNVVPKHIM